MFSHHNRDQRTRDVMKEPPPLGALSTFQNPRNKDWRIGPGIKVGDIVFRKQALQCRGSPQRSQRQPTSFGRPVESMNFLRIKEPLTQKFTNRTKCAGGEGAVNMTCRFTELFCHLGSCSRIFTDKLWRPRRVPNARLEPSGGILDLPFIF